MVEYFTVAFNFILFLVYKNYSSPSPSFWTYYTVVT